MSNMTQFYSNDKTYYLECGETEEFEKNLNGILTEIETFETPFDNEEFFKELNIDEIFEKIKENCLKTNNIEEFSEILRKILLISDNYKSTEIWPVFEMFCNKIINLDSLEEG